MIQNNFPLNRFLYLWNDFYLETTSNIENSNNSRVTDSTVIYYLNNLIFIFIKCSSAEGVALLFRSGTNNQILIKSTLFSQC
jgi:hypothetical protein